MTTPTVEGLLQGTATDVMTTELNSMASSNVTSSSSFSNAQGTANWNGYPYGQLILTLASYSGSVAANSAFQGWFLYSKDNSTFEYAAGTPARAPDFIIPIAASGAYTWTIQDVKLPQGYFEILANQSTGLTFASSGNKLTVLPYTYQGVGV